jgi:hypothetical protein
MGSRRLRALQRSDYQKSDDRGGKLPAMNERQQVHIDYYLQRLEYWRGRKPAYPAARGLVARDADEAHPLRTEEETMEVVDYLWRLEREQAAT